MNVFNLYTLRAGVPSLSLIPTESHFATSGDPLQIQAWWGTVGFPIVIFTLTQKLVLALISIKFAVISNSSGFVERPHWFS